MTAFVALFVALSVLTGVALRRDIRKAVRRREMRRLRQAEIGAIMGAMSGLAVGFRELGASAAQAQEGLRKFADAFNAREEALTSPFEPSIHQKGTPVV